MSEENNDNKNMPENNQTQVQPENDNQSTPDNDSANPYNTIIEQQQAQIDALIAQTTALNNQIINMVNSGAQFNDGQQTQQVQQVQQVQPVSLSDDEDYSLESLAKEIGKR